MNVSCLQTIVPFACAALLATATVATAQQITIAEQLYPGAVEGDRGPLLKRLVDDLTGEPLAGAEVFLVLESKRPLAGEFWWTYRGVSDVDGFVRIEQPNGDRDWHILVCKHARNGVAVSSAKRELVWRVGRGQDVPVRIVDWLGRPASGAAIGFCGYCGHTPDVATARADAQGLAILRGIDVHQQIADLYVQHPGLELFYDTIDWRPGDPPAEVACAHSAAQRGRVLDHEGKPVVGAFVCGGGRHRGPWAKTDAEGQYVVLGAEPGDSVFKIVLPSGREFACDAARDAEVTVRLPDLRNAEAREAAATPTREDVPERAIPLRALRVAVDGAPGAADELRVKAVFPGESSDDERVFAGEVQVPQSGPFVLLAYVGDPSDWSRREFAFPDGVPAAEPLRLRWVPESQVRGQCLGADGEPTAAEVRWLRSGDDEPATRTAADGTFVLTPPEPRKWGTRWFVLEFRAVGASAWRRRHVRIPETGSPDLDLGRVRVAGPAPLVVVDAKGEPATDVQVAFVREGWHQPGEPVAMPLQADGSWFGAELRAGDAIVVEREGQLPFRTVLRGGGPWRIELPDTLLRLQVVDPAGQPVDATVLVGDLVDEARDGEFELRGLSVGRHRLHVSAPGHRSAIAELEVVPAGVDGDVAPLRIVLPPR